MVSWNGEQGTINFCKKNTATVQPNSLFHNYDNDNNNNNNLGLQCTFTFDLW